MSDELKSTDSNSNAEPLKITTPTGVSAQVSTAHVTTIETSATATASTDTSLTEQTDISTRSPLESTIEKMGVPLSMEVSIPKSEMALPEMSITTETWKDRPSPKSEFVQNLFGQISKSYDRANDFISFGMARLWRRELVKWSGVELGQSVLDCATGTGDLAFAFRHAVGASGSVTGIDFCPEMLDIAVEKSHDRNLPVVFDFGNVLDLNFKDKSFDVTSIAYGLRNVERTDLALMEMARVTKSGGSVMILETGEVTIPVLRHFIRYYFEKIVPKVGGWISGNTSAYNYLQKSSGEFPARKELCELIMATDHYHSVQYRSLMGGASYIYKAVVK